MLYDYAYLIGSLLLLAVWFGLFVAKPGLRRKILRVSLATVFLGVTEIFFIPKYWEPLTLFNLGSRYHIDIEAIIFSFAVGGIAVSIYEAFNKVEHRKLTAHEIHHPKHKFHLLALLSSPISFIFLYTLSSLNPIYSTILSLIIGALATFYCRSDLVKKMIASGIIFFFIYFIFFAIFNILFPGYIQEVWNLNVLSGVLFFGVPLEELAFAASLGLMWSSVYEHIFWYKVRD